MKLLLQLFPQNFLETFLKILLAAEICFIYPVDLNNSRNVYLHSKVWGLSCIQIPFFIIEDIWLFQIVNLEEKHQTNDNTC